MLNLRGKPQSSAIVWCLLFAFSASANPRKEQAHTIYHQRVDAYIQEQVKKTLEQYASMINSRSSEAFAELNELAQELENSVDTEHPDVADQDYKSFLAARRHNQMKQALRQDRIEALTANMKKFRLLLQELNHESACESSIFASFQNGAPQYEIDESIDTSGIAEPRQYGVDLAVGSQIPSADIIEKGLFIPATTGGCLLGQSIIPIPFLGCLIGAVVGSVAAYGAGKGSTAILTASENQKERFAYESAVGKERARQQQEIDDAHIFMKDNPINEDRLASGTLGLCAKHDFSLPNKLLGSTDDWLTLLRETHATFAVQSSELDGRARALRVDSIHAARASNRQSAQTTQNAFLSSFAKTASDVDATTLRRTFISCMVEAGDSCDAIELCLDETDAAAAGKGEAFTDVRSMVLSSRQNLGHCKNVGDEHAS